MSHDDELAQFSDIPGTTLFTTLSSRRAYQLHRFCQSLMKAHNRAQFKADEAAYLDASRCQPSSARPCAIAISIGSLPWVASIFPVQDFKHRRLECEQAVATMSGMTPEAYAAMMLEGGRSPAGN